MDENRQEGFKPLLNFLFVNLSFHLNLPDDELDRINKELLGDETPDSNRREIALSVQHAPRFPIEREIHRYLIFKCDFESSQRKSKFRPKQFEEDYPVTAKELKIFQFRQNGNDKKNYIRNEFHITLNTKQPSPNEAPKVNRIRKYSNDGTVSESVVIRYKEQTWKLQGQSGEWEKEEHGDYVDDGTRVYKEGDGSIIIDESSDTVVLVGFQSKNGQWIEKNTFENGKASDELKKLLKLASFEGQPYNRQTPRAYNAYFQAVADCLSVYVEVLNRQYNLRKLTKRALSILLLFLLKNGGGYEAYYRMITNAGYQYKASKDSERYRIRKWKRMLEVQNEEFFEQETEILQRAFFENGSVLDSIPFMASMDDTTVFSRELTRIKKNFRDAILKEKVPLNAASSRLINYLDGTSTDITYANQTVVQPFVPFYNQSPSVIENVYESQPQQFVPVQVPVDLEIELYGNYLDVSRYVSDQEYSKDFFDQTMAAVYSESLLQSEYNLNEKLNILKQKIDKTVKVQVFTQESTDVAENIKDLFTTDYKIFKQHSNVLSNMFKSKNTVKQADSLNNFKEFLNFGQIGDWRTETEKRIQLTNALQRYQQGFFKEMDEILKGSDVNLTLLKGEVDDLFFKNMNKLTQIKKYLDEKNISLVDVKGESEPDSLTNENISPPEDSSNGWGFMNFFSALEEGSETAPSNVKAKGSPEPASPQTSFAEIESLIKELQASTEWSKIKQEDQQKLFQNIGEGILGMSETLDLTRAVLDKGVVRKTLEILNSNFFSGLNAFNKQQYANKKMQLAYEQTNDEWEKRKEKLMASIESLDTVNKLKDNELEAGTTEKITEADIFQNAVSLFEPKDYVDRPRFDVASHPIIQALFLKPKYDTAFVPLSNKEAVMFFGKTVPRFFESVSGLRLPDNDFYNDMSQEFSSGDVNFIPLEYFKRGLKAVSTTMKYKVAQLIQTHEPEVREGTAFIYKDSQFLIFDNVFKEILSCMNDFFSPFLPSGVTASSLLSPFHIQLMDMFVVFEAAPWVEAVFSDSLADMLNYGYEKSSFVNQNYEIQQFFEATPFRPELGINDAGNLLEPFIFPSFSMVMDFLKGNNMVDQIQALSCFTIVTSISNTLDFYKFQRGYEPIKPRDSLEDEGSTQLKKHERFKYLLDDSLQLDRSSFENGTYKTAIQKHFEKGTLTDKEKAYKNIMFARKPIYIFKTDSTRADFERLRERITDLSLEEADANFLFKANTTFLGITPMFERLNLRVYEDARAVPGLNLGTLGDVTPDKSRKANLDKIVEDIAASKGDTWKGEAFFEKTNRNMVESFLKPWAYKLSGANMTDDTIKSKIEYQIERMGKIKTRAEELENIRGFFFEIAFKNYGTATDDTFNIISDILSLPVSYSALALIANSIIQLIVGLNNRGNEDKIKQKFAELQDLLEAPNVCEASPASLSSINPIYYT